MPLAELKALTPPAVHRKLAAALKKAFHKASRKLHPDKLGELPSARRAEAEEVFKCLSTAFHAGSEA